jgi:uncharacterized protein (DUF697 family)
MDELNEMFPANAEYEGEYEGDYEGEAEGFDIPRQPLHHRRHHHHHPRFDAEPSAGVLSEEQELALATELLSVTHDQELEQFLGGIFDKVAKAVKGVISSPIGHALGGVLKQVAKTALPTIGGALGTMVGGPAGTALGSQLGSAAGKLFGLELEGMSNEDKELEVAQRVVRLAADAAAHAAQGAPAGTSPQDAARAALAAAAARSAPGLLRNGLPGAKPSRPAASPEAASPARATRGIWARHGRHIVLYGA